MGAGSSYRPVCCWHPSNAVTYVAKIAGQHTDLAPWWRQTFLSNDESLYWACRECVPLLPVQYRPSFQKVENYTVHGM